MSLIAKEKGGSSIPPLDPDVYEAVCTAIIDLGTQTTEYEGVSKTARRVFFTWAVDGETVEIDGEAKPRVISREYPVSLHERARLRADLEGWRGKPFTKDELAGFDLKNVLGKPCRLNTGLTSGGNAKVTGILKTKQPAQVPEGMETVFFSLDDWSGGELPEAIPEFICNKIIESPEYRAKTKPAVREVDVAVNDDLGEDVPF